MKVRVVGFQKTIGMPNFSNDKPIVVEADLEPGETMEEAWSKMNKAAIEWHQKEYPHLYVLDLGLQPLAQEYKENIISSYQGLGTAKIIYKEETPDQSNDVRIAIQNADSIDKLTPWKLPASQDKELYSLYMKRLKDITK